MRPLQPRETIPDGDVGAPLKTQDRRILYAALFPIPDGDVGAPLKSGIGGRFHSGALPIPDGDVGAPLKMRRRHVRDGRRRRSPTATSGLR